uniref:Uncharacterized protein n=1 Tax=Alexandrium monilatum TaxID=311494 RepID=A0A7S4US76_9DINO
MVPWKDQRLAWSAAEPVYADWINIDINSYDFVIRFCEEKRPQLATRFRAAALPTGGAAAEPAGAERLRRRAERRVTLAGLLDSERGLLDRCVESLELRVTILRQLLRCCAVASPGIIREDLATPDEV